MSPNQHLKGGVCYGDLTANPHRGSAGSHHRSFVVEIRARQALVLSPGNWVRGVPALWERVSAVS